MATHQELLVTLRNGWFERIKALGISPKEFCRRSEVNYDTLRRTRNPRIKTLDKIEKEVAKLERVKAGE